MIFERNKDFKKKLCEFLKNIDSEQVIILSDFPDPDSIVSSVLLKIIFDQYNIKSSNQ